MLMSGNFFTYKVHIIGEELSFKEDNPYYVHVFSDARKQERIILY